MLEGMEKFMKDKETAKAAFVIMKSQLKAQLDMSKNALKGVLETDDLEEDEVAIFEELDVSMDKTADCLGKVIDLIIKKIDEAE